MAASRPSTFARPATRKAAAFTLVELLVALALSALLLRLVLPLFAAARGGTLGGEAAADGTLATWRSVLRADLARLVSPARAGMPLVQVETGGDGRLQRLVLQSLSPQGIGNRGPLEVTYELESENGDSVRGELALVRSGRGWHDGQRTRHVLMGGLTGWELRPVENPSQAPLPDRSLEDSAAHDASVLRIVLHRVDGTDASGTFWVAARADAREPSERRETQR